MNFHEISRKISLETKRKNDDILRVIWFVISEMNI